MASEDPVNGKTADINNIVPILTNRSKDESLAIGFLTNSSAELTDRYNTQETKDHFTEYIFPCLDKSTSDISKNQ